MSTSRSITSERKRAEPGFNPLDQVPGGVLPRRGANRNERLGLAIAKTPGMMRRVDDGTYGARSRNSDRRYAAARIRSR